MAKIYLRSLVENAIRTKEGQGTLFRPGALGRLMEGLPESAEGAVLNMHLDTLDKRFQKEEMPQFGAGR